MFRDDSAGVPRAGYSRCSARVKSPPDIEAAPVATHISWSHGPMHIPQAWAKAGAECQTQDHRKLQVAVWGWGGEQEAAKREAANRLERLIGRIRRGDPFPGVYAYGSRPLREEILQTFDRETEDPRAILTRNRYGALVLNTARLLFLDIDAPAPTFSQRLRRMFSRAHFAEDDDAIAKLRETLRQLGRATFRLYRTAAGFRAIAV